MFATANQHHRMKLVLIAPVNKCRTFILGAGYVCRDLLDVHKSQRVQFFNKPGSLITVGNTSAGELVFDGSASVGEDRDSRGHASVNEVGSFQYSCAIGFARNDNDVCGFDGFIDNESSPRGLQNRMSSRGYSNAENGQQHEYERDSTSQASRNHRLDDT